MHLKPERSIEPLWTKSFLLLIVGNLFVFMGFQMLLPIMPPYIQSLGASGVEIGLVTTLFSIGAVIIRPFIGYLLEYKRRKPLLLVGALSLLTITVIYPLTQMVFIFLLFRLMHGLAWGWSTTVNGTAAVDVVPNSRLGEGMGYFGLSITIGMIIAPSLGIFLFQHFGFQINMMVSALLCIAALVMFACLKDHTPDSVINRDLKQLKFSFFGSLIEKNSWYPALVTLTSTFGYGSIVTFIVIFGEERGISAIYLFYLVNALVATLIRPITGRWFDQRGPQGLIIVCASLTFAALWILSFADSNIDLVISGMLFGAGYGSLIPALQAWVLAKTSPERRGVANGMYYSGIDLGIGLSGLVFGIFAPYVNTGTLFQMSSVFFLLVIIMTIFARGQEMTFGQQQKFDE